MKKSAVAATLLLTMGVLLYSSCKKSSTPTPAATTTTTTGPSLYTQVGGSTMVTDPAPISGGPAMIEKGRLTLRSVVDSSIFVIAADTQMTKYFTVLLGEVGKSDLTGYTALSENFTNFLCTATGCTNTAYAYGGKSMQDAHNPQLNPRIAHAVTAADFNKFVGDIGTGLAQNGVKAPADSALINKLVALLYTTESGVINQ